MKKKWRVLIVEDLPSDAELAERELKTVLKNYTVKVVDTEEDFVQALDTFKPDLIISDYQLPTFNGLSALKITQKKSPFSPFIILTGSMNEDTAVECMKAGADDYVIKEHIMRLGTSVLGTLKKKKVEKERVQALEALRKSEQQYRDLINHAQEGIWVIDKDANTSFVNPSMAKILGYTPDEMIGKHLFSLMDKRGIELAKINLVRRRRGIKEQHDFEFIRKDSGRIYTTMITAPILDEAGNYNGAIAGVIDITERKRAEKALRESEQWNKEIFEGSRDAIFIVDTNAHIIDVNKAATSLTGYSKDELLKMLIPDLHEEGDLEAYNEFFKRIIGGESITSEAKIFRKDGTIIETEFSNKQLIINGILYMHTIAHDITERKRSQRIQTIQLNITRAMVAASDLNALFTEVRNELKILIDTKNFLLALYDEKTGLLHTLFEKDEKDSIPTSWKAEGSITGQVVIQKKSFLLNKNEIRKLAHNGQINIIGTLPEVWLGIPLFADGKIVGALVIQNYEDPTLYDQSIVEFLKGLANQLGIYISQKKTEAERERLSAAIEQAAEAVVITDTQGNIQYINPAFENITGYTHTEVLGKNPRILKSGKQDPSFYKELWDTISTGHVWRGKVVNRRRDGSLFTEESTISPVFDKDGNISNYVAVKRDVTKEEELEQQFRQAQKMESVGRLAGGVAHDFNNMLSVILGYSELALAKLNPEDKFYKILREIHKAGSRSADLTTQLLAFSRKQTITPQVMNLNDAVSSMLKMLRRLIGEDIDLVWIPGANLWTNYIDPAQIDQILANLCVNARDAINDTGKIIIETGNVTLDEAFCQKHAYAKSGSYVMLTVSDDGCGMDEKIKNQIFEPFFTTKAEGEGTGLGLATVYGIVKQNKGLINVYSESGQGASFKIYFPRYEGKGSVEKEKEKKLHRGHGERILLVEDELAILEMTQSILEGLGYSVIAARTTEEAMHLAQEQGDKIELVMTDVVMPGMNGKELATKLQTLFPKLKIVFMSGYTSNIIAHRGVLDAGINFITKPFSLAGLAEKVSTVLKS